MSPLASFRQVTACSALAFVTCTLSVATWAADKPAANKPVELTQNVAAQIAHSALLSAEATAKPDALAVTIRRVNDNSAIATDDVTITVDGKNESVTRTATVYELPINDLRGEGVKDVDITVAHDGIREIISGKVSVAELPAASLFRDHKQVAWWVLNIVIVLIAAMAFSRKKTEKEEKEESEEEG